MCIYMYIRRARTHVHTYLRTLFRYLEQFALFTERDADVGEFGRSSGWKDGWATSGVVGDGGSPAKRVEA